MKKINRLAIIPARHGSKRIKNKNIKTFKKKPLIYYAIKSAINSNLFNKIHVSSDSEKILNYSKKIGVQHDFKRSKNLSGDKVPLAPVLEFVVDEYLKRGQNFDEVWLIYPTNPFITQNVLRKCSKRFKKISANPKNALMTVTKYNYPIFWAQKKNEKGYLSAVFKKYLKLRSQDLNNIYCDAGMINIYSGIKFLKKIKNIKYFPFELPIYESVDIDTVQDFKFAAKIFYK